MPTSISAWFVSRGVVATPGGFISDTPWAGTKTHASWETRDQDSANLGGGRLRSSGAQNNEITRDHWLPAGTLKIAIIYRRNTDAGIFSLQFDGVTQGTVDSYAAAFDNNNYSEVTGLTKATASLVVVKEIMATKNASSSNYAGNIQTLAIVRTGA